MSSSWKHSQFLAVLPSCLSFLSPPAYAASVVWHLSRVQDALSVAP